MEKLFVRTQRLVQPVLSAEFLFKNLIKIDLLVEIACYSAASLIETEMVIHCVVYGCTNNQTKARNKGKKIHFYRFTEKPWEKTRMKTWISFVRRKQLVTNTNTV